MFFPINTLTKYVVVGLAGALWVLAPGVTSAQWPGLFEAKAIAEEGFIYGLPKARQNYLYSSAELTRPCLFEASLTSNHAT
jgi:hypothetical protein